MHATRAARPGLYAAVLFALFAAPQLVEAQTPPGRLSLGEAISLARENNPEYLTQRTQIRSAEWGVRAAYGSLLPTITSSTGFGYTAPGERRFDSVVLDRQPAQLSSQYRLGLSLSLDGQTLLGPSVAKAQELAAAETVEGAAANLEADVTQRYIAVLEAQATIVQAERELTRTAEHVRLAEARLEVGAGTQLDVSRALVQQGQAQVRLLQAQSTAANNRLLLSQVVGVPLPDAVELTESFTLFDPPWSTDELVQVAVGENPTLRASRAQADAAGTRARAAASTYLPTVSFSAGLSGYVSQASTVSPAVTQELQRAANAFANCQRQNELYARVELPLSNCIDPATPGFEQSLRAEFESLNRGFPFEYIRQPANVSMSISLPIFTGLQRQQQIEEARIARLNAQYQVQSQELQVRVDVEMALRNLETAYQSALLQQQIRETAEEELRLAQERFRFGATTSVEVVDAQASLAEAERAEIAALYEFQRSLAVLEARLGEPLER
ncbi:MAG: TolC family protein [Gemmatimonadota bacterium]